MNDEKTAGGLSALTEVLGEDEYFHTLIAKGGKVLGYGNVITSSDWQIHGHKNNIAICPPEDKWIGYKTIPYPHPTFIRMPPNAQLTGAARAED